MQLPGEGRQGFLTGHVLTQQPANIRVHASNASILLMKQRNSWHLLNAAAENETDRLKAEIGSLRDRVDHFSYKQPWKITRRATFQNVHAPQSWMLHTNWKSHLPSLNTWMTRLLIFQALTFCSYMDLDD